MAILGHESSARGGNNARRTGLGGYDTTALFGFEAAGLCWERAYLTDANEAKGAPEGAAFPTGRASNLRAECESRLARRRLEVQVEPIDPALHDVAAVLWF